MISQTELELIEQYIDGTLSDNGIDQLKDLLSNSPEARAMLRSLATVEFGLQDIAASSNLKSENAKNELPETAVSNGQPWTQLAKIMTAIATALIVALGASLFVQRYSYENKISQLVSSNKTNTIPHIAKVIGLGGAVLWTGDGGRVTNDLKIGDSLTGGTIQGAKPDSWVSLKFDDSSTVTISGDSRLVFSDFGQKVLHLFDGSVSANVSPQPKGKPMLVHTRSALLEVVGTQFDVETDFGSTALDVNEGKVNVKRLVDGQSIEVPANHRVVAETGRKLAVVLIPESTNRWSSDLPLGPSRAHGKWRPENATQEASLSPVPLSYANPIDGKTKSIFAATFQVSTGDSPPVYLQTGSKIRIRGHVDDVFDSAMGITVRHPNGGFGGNFLVYVPSALLRTEEDFELVIEADDFALDPALRTMKDEFVETPLNVAVESFWCGAELEPTGMKIYEVEILPPEASDMNSSVQDRQQKPNSSSAKPTAESIVKFMDKNGNGKIDKSEASKELQANFQYLDTNGDGLIDVKEAAAMVAYANKPKDQPKTQTKPQSQTDPQSKDRPKRATAKSMIASMDRNGDGKISKDEAPQQLAASWQYVDVNKDGEIDLEEAQAMADYANKQQDELSEEMNKSSTVEATAEKVIAMLDKNDDGKISKEESSGEMAKNFDYIDADHDGLVNATEAQAALDYAKNNGNPVTMEQISGSSNPDIKNDKLNSNLKPEELVASMDKNGDGKITKDEAPEDLVLFFGNYDTNSDGVIDKKETAALVKYLKDSSVNVGKTKPKNQPTSGRVTAKSIVNQMDTNGDGRISKEEAPEQLKAAWQYIDTDKDGEIDLKEAQAIADYQNNQK